MSFGVGTGNIEKWFHILCFFVLSRFAIISHDNTDLCLLVFSFTRIHTSHACVFPKARVTFFNSQHCLERDFNEKKK